MRWISSIKKTYLVEEEVDGMCIELEWESLQEGDVVCQHLFIGEVKFVNNYRIDMVIWKQEIYNKHNTITENRQIDTVAKWHLQHVIALKTYSKIPNISPGLIEVLKHFLGGLYSGRLTFGGAYIRRAFCVSVRVSRPRNSLLYITVVGKKGVS